MKLNVRDLVVPVIAAVVLALTLQQTLAALRASGSWRTRAHGPRVRAEDPYTRVDDLFAEPAPAGAEGLRNPFTFGAARVATGPVTHAPRPATTPVAVVPAAPPKPTLTSIIFDADPRATVRYNGVDYSVRVNSLFADFRVKSITANEVTLDRNGETVVLGLRPKGD